MNCYNCGLLLPLDAIECPNCRQFIYTTFNMPMASKGRRLDGCLPSAPSPKDFKAVPNLENLPRKVDLRAYCTPVEDQAQIGSCTACASVGAVEFRNKREGKPHVDLSRLFVYFNARRMRGAEGTDAGATMADSLASLLAFGAPPEEMWPYDMDTLTKLPGDAVYDKARPNQPTEYARIDGLDAIKGAVAREHPVVFASFVPQRCYDEARRTGVVPAATAAELDTMRSLHGNHAMLVVGYDQDDKTFLIRNSWGEGFGDKGYCRMPFEVFESVLAPNTTWILGQLEASGAFTLVRPGRATIKPAEGGVRDLASKLREDIRSSLTKDIQDSMKDIKDRFKRQ